MKYSIKRLVTPGGKTKFELRMTIGRGKSVQKRTLRFDSKADAQDFVDQEILRIAEARKERDELKRMGLAQDEVRTWDTELKYWEEHAKPTLSPGWASTVAAFAKETHHLLAGKQVYTQISHETIDNVVAFLMRPRPILKNGKTLRMKKPDSIKTIWLKVGWIQSVLNFSVQKKRLKYSPIAEYSKTKPPEPETEFWERPEAEGFLSYADKKYPFGSERRWIYVAYLTKISAALRESELFALKPRCMKRSLEQLYLTEQWNKAAKQFTPLKGKACRNVPMNADVLSELTDLIRRGRLKADNLIFTINDKPLIHKNFYAQFQRDVKAWGGRKISVHGMRHTGATLMLLAGVDLRTLQAILGHVDIKTTERYAHLVNSKITEAGRKFSLNLGVNSQARDK